MNYKIVRVTYSSFVVSIALFPFILMSFKDLINDYLSLNNLIVLFILLVIPTIALKLIFEKKYHLKNLGNRLGYLSLGIAAIWFVAELIRFTF